MSERIRPYRGVVAGVLSALLVSAILALLVRPFRVGPVGFDSAASVIHFDRIVAGLRLEDFVTATPKPLLTLLYGLTHAVLPDWRAISWIALGAFGLAAILAGMVVRRGAPGSPVLLAVPLAAAALLGSSQLVLDVGLAYAVSWALVGWLVAAVAATSRPIRPWLVGLGLLVASLARLETSVVTGVVMLAALVRLARPAREVTAHTWTARRLATTAMIGACALPIMLLHDWLLTGDPFFWLSVSAAFSEATPTLPTPVETIGQVLQVGLQRPIAAIMALLAVVLLVRDRHPLGVGLLALGGGVAVLLVALAVRQTYVSYRYYAAIELALVVASAIGVCRVAPMLARLVARRLGPHLAGPAAATAAAALAVASLLAGPFAPLDAAVRGSLDLQREYALVGDTGGAVVAPLLADRGLAGGEPAPFDVAPVLFVPVLLRPRLAVDLDLPLWAVTRIDPSIVAVDGGGVRPGQLIIHSGRIDRPREPYDVLETGADVILGPRRLVPVAALRPAIWVLEVR